MLRNWLSALLVSMRNALIVCIVAAPVAISAAAVSQGVPITDFDFAAAEHHLKDLLPPVPKTLHEEERGPDGTKGYGLPNPIAQRVAPPTPLPPPFTTVLEWNTLGTYCAWDAIVQAMLLDSTPILSSDKSMIYTVSHFAVVDTIKGDSISSGQHIVAYRVGGELVDAGERLRIDTPDMAAFQPQKNYILILLKDRSASAQQYWIPQGPTVAVNNEKVYPIAGKYSWLTGADAFPSGAKYDTVRNTFMTVARLSHDQRFVECGS